MTFQYQKQSIQIDTIRKAVCTIHQVISGQIWWDFCGCGEKNTLCGAYGYRPKGARHELLAPFSETCFSSYDPTGPYIPRDWRKFPSAFWGGMWETTLISRVNNHKGAREPISKPFAWAASNYRAGRAFVFWL